jgi:ribulose phosphate 3-epimerase family protein
MTVLAQWHANFSGSIAGSVYATTGSRLVLARELADAGVAVHVDVMAVSEGLPPGVSLAELQMIAAAVDRSAIGVHLIGSADFVDAVLPKILTLRPGVVFLPWGAFSDERAHAIRAVGGSAWIAVWREWDGRDDPQWPSGPDGVLIMLIEPGSRDCAQVNRLDIVTACTARFPGLPVAVDGGVTEEMAPLCAAAGVSQMVVGRALLTREGREAL